MGAIGFDGDEEGSVACPPSRNGVNNPGTYKCQRQRICTRSCGLIKPKEPLN